MPTVATAPQIRRRIQGLRTDGTATKIIIERREARLRSWIVVADTSRRMSSHAHQRRGVKYHAAGRSHRRLPLSWLMSHGRLVMAGWSWLIAPVLVERNSGVRLEARFALAAEHPDHDAYECSDEDEKIDRLGHGCAPRYRPAARVSRLRHQLAASERRPLTVRKLTKAALR